MGHLILQRLALHQLHVTCSSENIWTIPEKKSVVELFMNTRKPLCFIHSEQFVALLWRIAEAYSEPCQTLKVELFEKIANDI